MGRCGRALCYLLGAGGQATGASRPRYLDGLEATRLLKASAATSSLPVLALSATLAVRSEALAVGADGFVEKPFDLDDFLGLIQRHLLVDTLAELPCEGAT